MIECPHCHVRVLLVGGALCPSCGKDTSTPPQYEHGMEPFVYYETTPLPPVCIRCAKGTDRVERHRFGQSSSGGPQPLEDVSMLPLRGLRNLARGIRLLVGLDKMLLGGAELRFEIPYCDDCNRKKPLSLLQVNTKDGYVRLLVSRVYLEVTRR
jgi:hypothetical protein